MSYNRLTAFQFVIAGDMSGIDQIRSCSRRMVFNKLSD